MRKWIVAAAVAAAFGAGILLGTQSTTATAQKQTVPPGSESEWFQYAVGWAQIAAPLVAAIGLGFIFVQIRQQRDALREQGVETAGARTDARADRAVSYQSTYSSRDFLTISARCAGFFDATDAGDCVRKLRSYYAARWADDRTLLRTPPSSPEARASRNDIHYVLGFFEALGGAYLHQIIDQATIRDDFARPAAYVYRDAWWFLCWERGTRSAQVSHTYDQFERFVKTLRAEREDLREIVPDPEIRVLCLPALDARGDWGPAARLSVALSNRVKRDGDSADGLITALRAAAGEAPRRPATGIPPIEHVILVPSAIDHDEASWAATHEQSATLSEVLGQLEPGHLDPIAARI